MTTPTPAPRTAYEWTRHCTHCQWRVLTFYGRTVGVFPDMNAVLAYVNQHPRGPR